ncbi:CBS domain-containing protein [archaeon]
MDAMDVMTDNVYFVGPGDTIAHIRRLLVQHKVSLLPVVDGGKVIGLVTERGISDALYHIHEPIDAVTAEEVMRKDVALVGPQASAEEIAKVFVDKSSPAVIVFDSENNEVQGIITKTDLTSHFIQNCSGEATVADLMRTNVQTIGKFHSIFRAAKEMEEHDIGRLVVVDPKPVGILTARDLALSTYGMRPDKLVYPRDKGKSRGVHFKPVIVEDLMQDELYTIPSKSDAVSAAKLMLDRGIGSVIVIDNNELKGILTKTDIVNYLAKNP